MSVDKWQNDIAMILFLMQMFVSLFKCLFSCGMKFLHMKENGKLDSL